MRHGEQSNTDRNRNDGNLSGRSDSDISASDRDDNREEGVDDRNGSPKQFSRRRGA
jgi:hypothetical protein